jgi:hypothetical protein
MLCLHVFFAGADPMADLLKLADELKFGKKFEKVSLGQGQGPKAEKLLEFGMDRGIWVCLQVCGGWRVGREMYLLMCVCVGGFVMDCSIWLCLQVWELEGGDVCIYGLADVCVCVGVGVGVGL